MKKFIALIIVCGLGYSAFSEEITVGGKGVVKAKPDMIQLRFDVSSLNKDLDVGLADLKAKNAAITSALTSVGVEKSEIKVSNISMNAQYSYGSMKGRTLEGYKQSCAFMINIALDMDRAQSIYKAIVGTKCGEEISFSFYIKDEKPYRNEAKKLAVANARETAALLAEAAGVSLGKVEEISYNAGGATPLRRANMVMAKMEFEPESDGLGMASSDIEDISIQESVVIIWELK